jgi:hypothetical protein
LTNEKDTREREREREREKRRLNSKKTIVENFNLSGLKGVLFFLLIIQLTKTCDKTRE